MSSIEFILLALPTPVRTPLFRLVYAPRFMGCAAWGRGGHSSRSSPPRAEWHPCRCGEARRRAGMMRGILGELSGEGDAARWWTGACRHTTQSSTARRGAARPGAASGADDSIIHVRQVEVEAIGRDLISHRNQVTSHQLDLTAATSLSEEFRPLFDAQ